MEPGFAAMQVVLPVILLHMVNPAFQRKLSATNAVCIPPYQAAHVCLLLQIRCKRINTQYNIHRVALFIRYFQPHQRAAACKYGAAKKAVAQNIAVNGGTIRHIPQYIFRATHMCSINSQKQIEALGKASKTAGIAPHSAPRFRAAALWPQLGVQYTVRLPLQLRTRRSQQRRVWRCQAPALLPLPATQCGCSSHSP